MLSLSWWRYYLQQNIWRNVSQLREVFLRLRTADLKLNPKKCIFFSRKMKYLWHIVSEEGVTTDSEKIYSVRNWPIPQNKKQLQSSLGFCSYYKRFLKGFSLIIKSLFALTENQNKFVWDDQYQKAFKKLKQFLMSSPILSFPIDIGKFILDTKASNNSIDSFFSGTEWDREDYRLSAVFWVSRKEIIVLLVVNFW